MAKKKMDPDEAAIRALDAEWGKAATAQKLADVVKFYATDASWCTGYAARHRSRHPRQLEKFARDARSVSDFAHPHDIADATSPLISGCAFQGECQTKRPQKYRKISRDLEARTRRLESVLRLLELEH